MDNQKIIAVLGLPGSGKTETVKYLVENYTLKKVYFGDVVFDEMKRRGLEVTEKNERLAREDLREKRGLLCLAEEVVKKIKSLKEEKIILVESLYSWEEYLYFKKFFGSQFETIAVHACPKVRYGRLSQRPVRPLSPEESESRDYAQIENLHQAGPIAMADYVVINEKTVDELCRQADSIIKRIKS